MAKTGRKSNYDPDTFPEKGEQEARKGLSDAQIAKNLGISVSQYYKYQNQFPQFKEAIKRGKEPVDLEVENALLRRALGYKYTEKTTEVRVDQHGNAIPAVVKEVVKEVPPDVGAICFWLKNRKPKVWKEVSKAEIQFPKLGADAAADVTYED